MPSHVTWLRNRSVLISTQYREKPMEVYWKKIDFGKDRDWQVVAGVWATVEFLQSDGNNAIFDEEKDSIYCFMQVNHRIYYYRVNEKDGTVFQSGLYSSRVFTEI